LLDQRGPKIIRYQPLCPAEWSLRLRGGKRALKQVEALLRLVGFENYVVSLEVRLAPAWPDRSLATAFGARRWLRVMVRDPELQRLTRVSAPALKEHRREGYARIEPGVRWLVAAAHASAFRLRSWGEEDSAWPAHLYVSGGVTEARRLVRFLRSRGQEVGFVALMRRSGGKERRTEVTAFVEFRSGAPGERRAAPH
jgi:hypothetical protein